MRRSLVTCLRKDSFCRKASRRHTNTEEKPHFLFSHSHVNIIKHYHLIDSLVTFQKMNKNLRILVLSGLFLAACLAFVRSGQCEQDVRFIRVAILQDAHTLRLKVKGGYEIIDLTEGKVLSRGNGLNTTVTVYKEGVLLGNLKADTNKLLLSPDDPESITVNARAFRGSIGIIKSGMKLTLFNSIELEDYIKGILYHEASHYWPMEALKAQAVVSRTYAVFQMQKNRDKDFDLTNDIYSQVYGGKASERMRTNNAVSQTEGEILTYRGKPFETFFHATCGGHTEDASRLWNIDIVPLKGVACGYCKESPHYSWHCNISLDEIAKKLNQAGFKVSHIKEIRILGRDNSGRITDLNIRTPKSSLVIPAKDFRSIVGPNVIRSTNFNAAAIETDAVFEGFGWGHGVGLCQWGAYFMAKDGRSYVDILKYYYPGAKVEAVRF